MKTPFLLLLTLSVLWGCKHNSNDEGAYAYVGGEIVNPNNNYVLLQSPEGVSDTLRLDDDNRFLKRLEGFTPGLYKFWHGGEYQLILLEPMDSIIFRLNTIDFDESLVFTGEGARKNNYLISTFVENETDNKKFMDMMWEMEPSSFEEALNSNRDKKLEALKVFLSNNEFSDYFKTIAETNINYEYYYNKEVYPFGYYGYNNLIHFKDLPEHFYDYRDDVDYNNERLLNVIPYKRFLFWHVNNIALRKYYQTATHNVVFNNKSVSYNLEKLRLVDSLIENKTIKDHLLKYTTRDFISVSIDSSEIAEVLNSFLEKSHSDVDKSYMKALAQSVNNLKPGNKLPETMLLDIDDNRVALNTLIDRPTVIYFWSSNLPLLLRNSHYKVRELEKKFPEIAFIAINITNDDKTHWKHLIDQHNFDASKEYRFLSLSESMDRLVINSVNKSIFVDKDARIINSNAMFITSEFEDELSQYVKTTKASHH